MALDLGKQMGPLPMGAWVVVVGSGLGIALYARRQSQQSPVVVTDTSGVPGVGTGAVGGWSTTTPAPTNNAPTITNNEEWARAAINWLIAQNYDANVADSAIRKYLSGDKQSVQEYTLSGMALQHFGSPPNPLPPGPEAPQVGGDPGADSTLAITDLHVDSVTQNSVTFSWSAVPKAVWYSHYYSVNGQSTGLWTTNATTRIITGIPRGATVTIGVFASNGFMSKRGPDAIIKAVTAL